MSRRIIPDPVARQPWHVILPLFALVLFGAAVLYSAAGGALSPWAGSHVLRFVVFLAMALVMCRFSREQFKLVSYPIYGVVLFLLVLVELIGGIGGGSQRWLNLGFMTLQPSELMKPVIVLFLAGLPLGWFIGAGVAAAIAAPISFFTLLHDYQRQRVFVFLDPAQDPLGTGYHIMQSTIAIGSGGLFGKGFLNGSQSHLDYLPEAHTDFVFATMAEEWGMLGGFFILAIFAWLLRWGMRVARSAPDRFSQLLAAGMTCTIFFYIAINLMMVMGLAPVVGIPLPFVSHGGSSMMTNMICVGTIMAVERWSLTGRRPLS